MIILAVIFLLIGLVFGAITIYFIIENNPVGILSFFVGVAFITVSIEVFYDYKYPTPTKQDVIDGKAIYQETQVITGNDTIKTYDIIWKQKN